MRWQIVRRRISNGLPPISNQFGSDYYHDSFRTNILFACHLPEHFRIQQSQAAICSLSSVPCVDASRTGQCIPPPWQKYKKSYEQQYIEELMCYAEGNITTACQVSQMSRARLYQLRGKYGMLASS